MNRWASWSLALLLVAFVTVGGRAQDKKDDVKKDAVKKDEPKKDAPRKDDAKPDDPKKDPPKKDDPKKDPPKKDDPKDKKPVPKTEPGQKTTKVVGEITQIETGKQGFRIKVTYQYVDINQGELQAYAREQGNYQQAIARRDFNAARNHQVEMLKHQAKIREVKSATKDYTLDSHPKMVVRLPAPKESFDEMGNVKKYSAKELDALRGKDRMFDGEFSDLTAGQIVQATVILPKAPAKPVNKDDILLEEPKIEATHVAVLRQPKLK